MPNFQDRQRWLDRGDSPGGGWGYIVFWALVIGLISLGKWGAMLGWWQ